MKLLNTALLGATFLLGAAAFSSANAADLTAPRGTSLKDEPGYAAPTSNWGGLYIGANAGGMLNNADTYYYAYGKDPRITGTVEGGRSGWLAGGQVGYNWQTRDKLVFGVEGDLDAGDGVDYLGSVRGRLGFAYKHSLVYATGGVAFAGFGDDKIFADDTQRGWVIGLGVEEKLRDNLSIGIEGLRYSFSDVDKLCCDGAKLDQDFWAVRARVNYHFNSSRDELLK